MSLDHTDEKLVRMANQIATFFLSQPEDIRAEGVATHINKFWEKRMRSRFFQMIDGGIGGFMPLVIEAAAQVKRPTSGDDSAVGLDQDAAASAPGGEGTASGESLSEPSVPERAH